jgi:hypothetical protein
MKKFLGKNKNFIKNYNRYFPSEGIDIIRNEDHKINEYEKIGNKFADFLFNNKQHPNSPKILSLLEFSWTIEKEELMEKQLEEMENHGKIITKEIEYDLDFDDDLKEEIEETKIDEGFKLPMEFVSVKDLINNSYFVI